MFYLTCLCIILTVKCQAPLEAKMNSYGVKVTATAVGTELKYENPDTDVKGNLIKNLKVDSDDATLKLAAITPKTADVMLNHPKLSVEGDMPQYAYDAKSIVEKAKEQKTPSEFIHSTRSQVIKIHKVLQDEPPQLDIPIELGVEKEQSKEMQESDKSMGKNCEEEDGTPCKPLQKLKKTKANVEFGSTNQDSGDEDEISGDNAKVQGEDELLSFPPDAPEIPIELGSAIEEENSQKGVASEECKGKRKPCQKPCANNCAKDDDDGDEPTPDIPVELGSAIMGSYNPQDTMSYMETVEGEDKVTYLRGETPSNFVMIGNDAEESGSSGDVDTDTGTKRTLHDTGSVKASGDEDARASNATSMFTKVNDGDYDGELLRNNDDLFSNNDPQHLRKRRSVVSKIQNKSNKMKKKKKKHAQGKTKWATQKNIYWSKFKTSKRSDIDVDQELLKTIESFDPDRKATKRTKTPKKKPLQGYMQNLAHDVRSVMSEAKTVLRNTGKVVHGLKRVINGANALTSFTDNAVKFAKYFSMEPNNATIDYLEEKAIVAVLEAQKAANEARDAANLAKLASEKARSAERRMEVARKQHHNLQALMYIRVANKQARRAEKAAKLASVDKQRTETDVMLMDKELKKMGSQLTEENNNNENKDDTTAAKAVPTDSPDNKANKTLVKQIESQYSPEAQQMLTTDASDVESTEKQVKQKEKEKAELSSESVSEKTHDTYANYFQMKQKQLESQLKNETPAAAETRNKETDTTTEKNAALSNKTSDTTNQAQEEAKLLREEQELHYIATLNKKIASIKKEEEDAKRRLESVEFAHKLAASVDTTNPNINVVHFTEQDNKDGFDSNLHKQLTEEGQFLHDNLIHEADNTHDKKNNLKLEPSKQVKSMLKNNVPGTVFKAAPKLAKVQSVVKNIPSIAYYNFKADSYNANRYTLYQPKKSATTETTHSNVPYIMAKKQMIKKTKKPSVHLVPGEYTGFKKHHIFEFHPEHVIKGYDTELTGHKTSKSEILPSATHVAKYNDNAMKEFEDGVGGDENVVVADDHDVERKHEKIVEETKLFNKINQDTNDMGSGDESNSTEKRSMAVPAVKKSDFSVVKEINKGPISLTVAVHHNVITKVRNASTAADNEKALENADPFGFNRIVETNEGGIVDRTYIPRPYEDKRIVHERSEIPVYNIALDNVKSKQRPIIIDDKK